MNIVDCFSYFNEKELLELRINLLHDHVDRFIITDADHTHKGEPKPFTCKNSLKELGIFSDKIEVVEVHLPSFEEETNAWVRENIQRDYASNFIQDGDICIVTDCDEIINPKFIEYYCQTSINHPNNIIKLPMFFFNGRADLRVFDIEGNPSPWNAGFICRKPHTIKYTLSQIRESSTMKTHKIEFESIILTENGIVEECGWHFSWMGDYERMKIKANSYLHANDFWLKNKLSLLDNYIPKEDGKDPLGRDEFILKKSPYEILPSKIFDLPRVRKYLLPNF